MNQLIAIGCVLGCVISTLGLIRVCEWLRPRDRVRRDAGYLSNPEEAPR